MTKFALLTTSLIAAGLVAGGLMAGGSAFGQPAATTPRTAAAPKTANVEQRVEQRIIEMHQRLKITPAQEQAWNTFAQVMRSNVTSTEQAYRQRATSVASMSAPDNLRNFAEIEMARAQGVQSLSAAFDPLYGMLSDEQKQTADAMFRHYEERGEAARNGAAKGGAAKSVAKQPG